jgi:uncharacterized protein YqhQ
MSPSPEGTPPSGSSPAADDKLRLGGMALRNGLLIHGPTSWAAAVRAASGEIRVASGRKPALARGAAGVVPGIRGVTRLAEALAIIPLVKRALPDARLPMEDVRMAAAMAAAGLAGQALRRTRVRLVVRESAVAAVSLLPALLALRGGELASYHGVEHKAIGAYEQEGDAEGATKEHDRCGSNLVAPLLASTVAGNVAARRAGLQGPLADGAVALGSLAVAAEVFAWSERHSDSALGRALRRPGYELQRAVGTREPSAEQLAVGAAALAEILAAEGHAPG